MRPNLTTAALSVSLLFNGAVLTGFMLGGGPPRDGGNPRQPMGAQGQRGPDGARDGRRNGRPGANRPDAPADGERPGPGAGPGPGPGPGPEGRPMDLHRAARMLDLTDEQRGMLEQLQAEHRETMKTFDEEGAVLGQMLDSELAKETISGQVIRDTLERRAELGRERRRAQADLFERFVEVLKPEQRRRLREQLGGPGRPEGPPPELMQRFDRDGNGELNADELGAARDAFEARRAEIRPRGPQGRPGRDGGPNGSSDGEARPPRGPDGRGEAGPPPRDGGPDGRPAGRPEGRGEGRRGPGQEDAGPDGRPPRPHPPLWAFFDRNGDGQLDEAETRERDEFIQSHPVSKAWRPAGPPPEREPE